ncbi:hypothetical protein KA107_00590 [Candidatus Pacearchaeota archaeon]|nr:hypothetical protein [Candidatus Pacearchaeota archaeon]
MKNTKQVIISVHDITPAFEKELATIFRSLNKLGLGKKKEAYIVLNWQERYPLNTNKDFITWLRKEFTPERLNFHGVTHYSKEKSLMDLILFGKDYSYVGEFNKKNSLNFKRSIKTGVALFKRIFKKSPTAFIPARWENSKSLMKICGDSKIIYTEDPLYLLNLKENKKVFSLPICFDYGQNYLLNFFSRGYANFIIFLSNLLSLPIRFSLHPNDVNNGNFKFAICLLEKLLEDGWNPVTNSEFWKESSN